MTSKNERSPRITTVGWGKMEVESLGPGRDYKLWPGGGRAWDWRETGTAHSPGIQVADVAELVERGCRVVILARGVFSRLKVTEEARSYLERHGVEVITADTGKGVRLYNERCDKLEPVGGLFHTTC